MIIRINISIKVIKTNKNGVKSINFYKSIAEFYYINGPMKVLVEKVY